MSPLSKLLIVFISFLFFGQANAQTEIAIFSRHKLSDGIVDIAFGETSNLIKPFGFAFEFIKDRSQYKLYSYGGGFRITNYNNEDLGRTTEFFVQAKIKLFKDFAKSDKLLAYFALGPRLVYMYNGDYNPGFSLFGSRIRNGGVAVPVLFNIDYKLSERWNIHFNINTLSTAFFLDSQFLYNPSIPDNLRTNSGFDFDANLFNEMRIGIGYTLYTE